MLVLTKKDLYPIKKFYNGEIDTNSVDMPTRERLTEIENKYFLKFENLYVTNNYHDAFIYWDENFIFSIPDFSSEFFKQMNLRKKYNKENLLATGWADYLETLPFALRYFMFEYYLETFKDDELLEILNKNFNLSIIDSSPLKDRIKKKLKPNKKLSKWIESALIENNKKLDKFITVYKPDNEHKKIFLLNAKDAIAESKTSEIFKAKIKVTDILFLNTIENIGLLKIGAFFEKINYDNLLK